MEPSRRRRVEAVDVVDLNRIETLPGTHVYPRLQHGFQRVELTKVEPPLVGVAVIDLAKGAGRETAAVPDRAGIGTVVLPGRVQVADCLRMNEGGGLPRRVDRSHLCRRRQKPIHVIQIDRRAPGPLDRNYDADLPVPAHRVTQRVEVGWIPARLTVAGYTRQRCWQRDDPPRKQDGRRTGGVGGADLDVVSAERQGAREEDV